MFVNTVVCSNSIDLHAFFAKVEQCEGTSPRDALGDMSSSFIPECLPEIDANPPSLQRK